MTFKEAGEHVVLFFSIRMEHCLETVGEASMSIHVKDCMFVHTFWRKFGSVLEDLKCTCCRWRNFTSKHVFPKYTSICIQGSMYKDVYLPLFIIMKDWK